MLRRIIAAVFAVVLLVTAAAYSRRQPSEAASELIAADTPESCLTSMVTAAQRGDVAAYLDCFTGAMRDELAIQAKGPSSQPFDAADFAEQLKTSIAGLKGIASERDGSDRLDQMKLVLERLYARHNEKHLVTLRRESDRWRISQMARVGAAVPPVEYGTPVFTPVP